MLSKAQGPRLHTGTSTIRCGWDGPDTYLRSRQMLSGFQVPAAVTRLPDPGILAVAF